MIFRVLWSFVVHRDNFSSKSVSDQMNMNLKKVKEFFVNSKQRNKNLLYFIHRCYDSREIPKIQLLQVGCCTFG
jgi:hypothetical protein